MGQRTGNLPPRARLGRTGGQGLRALLRTHGPHAPSLASCALRTAYPSGRAITTGLLEARRWTSPPLPSPSSGSNRAARCPNGNGQIKRYEQEAPPETRLQGSSLPEGAGTRGTGREEATTGTLKSLCWGSYKIRCRRPHKT